MYIISGQFRNRRLMSPKGAQTRPTASRLREALFNICQNYIEDSNFLDLFAGSGAMGLEALSRGAKSSTFVENHRETLKVIHSNIKTLNLERNCTVLSLPVFNALKMLEKQKKCFEIIYADPPYNTETELEGVKGLYSELVIRWMDKNHLLASNGTFFVEEETKFVRNLENLETLQLVDSRNYGHSTLQIYKKLESAR